MNLIPAFLTILLAQAGSGPSEAGPPRQLSGHSGPVYDVSISPDARLVATASFDGSLKVWNVADLSLIHI